MTKEIVFSQIPPCFIYNRRGLIKLDRYRGVKLLGEITTHSETAESFSTRFTKHSTTMKNKKSRILANIY